MPFQKTASVSTLAVAENTEKGLKKTAAYGDNESAFISGIRPIDIKAALELVASEYNISTEPSDYIFEAIRGNTTNVPNDNHDCFHKNELLRFDHRLGKQVYRTYELKPHHIQHRAENPKAARGFILDAHYNDSALPQDICGNCGNKTAERANRDPETGIHCNKCGSVVKDEFVELLVAIDTKKDPAFANGVKNGVLKHGSMGCSCLRTRCNICNNVAYSRSEFCNHIAGNKGREYDESENGFSPIAFTVMVPKDKTAASVRKIAKAFEWCEGVIYDEYSRVHDPADPTAEQYEILQLIAKVAELSNGDELKNESEILILQAKVAELEETLNKKIAQAMPPLPPAPPPGESPGDMPPPGLPSIKEPEEDKNVDKVVVNINTEEDGVELDVDKELKEVAEPRIPIEELMPEEMGATPAGPGEKLSPADMGIMPSAPPKRGSNETGGPSMLRFAESYKHLQAEITSAGNVRIHDNKGTLFVIKPENLAINNKSASTDGKDLTKEVLSMIAKHGMGGTITRTNAIVASRMASVLDSYVDDMTKDRAPDTSSALDEAEEDTVEKRSKDKKTETAIGLGSESDKTEEWDTKTLKDDVLTDRDTDFEDEKHERKSDDLSSLDMKDSDMRVKHKEWKMTQSTLDDITLDHQEKAAAKKCKECKCDPCECKAADRKRHAARLEQIYQTRLSKKVAELKEEKEEFINNYSSRFAKALKIVAKRQALNLEHSPMKEAFGLTLCNPCDLGGGYEYEPMDQRTAVTLVETAFSNPIVDGAGPAWENHIDGLMERAAEIMKWNDETLIQAEKDLSNIKTAAVPMINEPVYQVADETLRVKASQGNLQLSSTETDNVRRIVDHRNAIRQAVGTTKVAEKLGKLI